MNKKQKAESNERIKKMGEDYKAKAKLDFIRGGMYDSTVSCCGHAIAAISMVTANAHASKVEDDKYLDKILDELKHAKRSIEQAIQNMETHKHFRRHGFHKD